MSTNYYLFSPHLIDGMTHEDVTEVDRQLFLRYHIGKRSAGWVFLWQGHESVKSVDDWINVVFTPGAMVVTEYDAEIEAVDFFEMAKAWGRPGGNRHPDVSHQVPDHYFTDADDHDFLTAQFS